MTQRYDILSGRADKDGKKRWTKIGVMWPSKQGEGFSIKLEALPLPNAEGEVWISAFVPRENDGQGMTGGRGSPDRQGTPNQRLPAGKDFPIDDEVPF
jgi:hypothetical protein